MSSFEQQIRRIDWASFEVSSTAAIGASPGIVGSFIRVTPRTLVQSRRHRRPVILVSGMKKHSVEVTLSKFCNRLWKVLSNLRPKTKEQPSESGWSILWLRINIYFVKKINSFQLEIIRLSLKRFESYSHYAYHWENRVTFHCLNWSCIKQQIQPIKTKTKNYLRTFLVAALSLSLYLRMEVANVFEMNKANWRSAGLLRT